MAHLENFRLKVFRAVAEHLNLRKVAEQLFLTQPAVTLQIKALENDLGMRLFDRTGGKITFTQQGSVLLGYAASGRAWLPIRSGGADRNHKYYDFDCPRRNDKPMVLVRLAVRCALIALLCDSPLDRTARPDHHPNN